MPANGPSEVGPGRAEGCPSPSPNFGSPAIYCPSLALNLCSLCPNLALHGPGWARLGLGPEANDKNLMKNDVASRLDLS